MTILGAGLARIRQIHPDTQVYKGDSRVCPCTWGWWVAPWYAQYVPYVTQYCFRPGNLSSGPDLGRSLVGKASKSALRPARRADFCGLPD